MKISASPENPQHMEILFEKDKDRLFSTLQTYLVLNACFAKGFLPPEEWGPGDWFFYQCKAYGPYEIRLPLFGPIENAKRGIDASYIKLTVTPSRAAPDSSSGAPNVREYIFKMIFPIFTEFYENHVDEIGKCFGEAAATWPEVWQFARVIRNAMAHGSRLSITSAKAKPVKWKGLVYGPEQNDREIFGTDIEIGDLLMMMFLMSGSLDDADLVNKLRGR